MERRTEIHIPAEVAKEAIAKGDLSDWRKMLQQATEVRLTTHINKDESVTFRERHLHSTHKKLS